ncbi:MAG: hypothetical protein GZ088_07445 [Acidipila sp.]|nr:hypothetical protein [Acidipila sp.]
MRLIKNLPNFALGLLAGICAPLAQAQSPDNLLPEQSAAKAKQLIQQSIQALGGPAYLGVKDFTCTGRMSSFEHSGAVIGTVQFSSSVKLPDKDRTEYSYKTYVPIIVGDLSRKHSTMDIHNGNAGWVLNGGGVQEIPVEDVARYQEQRNKSINVLLRERLNDPNFRFHWAGRENLDLRSVQWVEIADAEHHTIRVAFDEQTHFPSRFVYQTLDPATRERNEEIEYLANFHTIEGVAMPFQRTRERNGLKYYQVFYDTCKFNTGLSDALFTREALEERFAQGNKGKKKNK